MSDPFPPNQTVDPILDPYDNEPPAWPKIVGIVSIVVSGLGLMCGGCAVGGLLFQGNLLKMAEQQMGPVPPPMLASPIQIAAAAAGLVWALVLLTAGIMLVSRRPIARPLHLLYSVGAIVLGAIGMALTVQQQAAVAEWLRQNPDSQWGKHQSSLGNAIGLAVAAVLSFAYPLFVLIYFGVVKRSSAAIAEGVGEPVA